ncbi:hypothetical protein DLM75_10115 [Leptospira stimsonii]|uniref:Uncharacterized protein n=1 Tax=Leptospira stimsonii TaxID=2202203 RepID=A0A396ZA95_9LEPT|nr:hypothetical protein DLM75_10115 [Leptospira stimsonii]
MRNDETCVFDLHSPEDSKAFFFVQKESEKNFLLETQNELFSMFKRISLRRTCFHCMENGIRFYTIWKREEDSILVLVSWISNALHEHSSQKRTIKERKILFGKGGGPSASILIKLRKVQMDRPSPHENRKKDPESFDTLQLRVEFCFL